LNPSSKWVVLEVDCAPNPEAFPASDGTNSNNAQARQQESFANTAKPGTRQSP